MCNKKSPYKQYLSSSFSHTLNSKNPVERVKAQPEREGAGNIGDS